MPVGPDTDKGVARPGPHTTKGRQYESSNEARMSSDMPLRPAAMPLPSASTSAQQGDKNGLADGTGS